MSISGVLGLLLLLSLETADCAGGVADLLLAELSDCVPISRRCGGLTIAPSQYAVYL